MSCPRINPHGIPCNGSRPLGGFAEVSAPAASDNSGTGAMVGMIVVGLACVGLVILIESGK
jgi:hypothetical protein